LIPLLSTFQNFAIRLMYGVAARCAAAPPPLYAAAAAALYRCAARWPLLLARCCCPGPRIMSVKGICHPAFAALRAALEEDFKQEGRSVGASVALCVDGNLVVDLWGGFADEAKTRSWDAGTIVNVWSACKAWSATCVLVLVDRGNVDLEAPLARYWPEFAQNGKECVTVRQALSHQAGVVTYRKYLGRADETTWEQLASELAQESLFWELGTDTRYHAFTFGVLAGELVRRVSGMTIGAFWQQHVAKPHGLDMFMGFGPELDARVADLVAGPGIPTADNLGRIGGDDVSNDELEAIAHKTSLNPLRTTDIVNTRGWRQREFPASGGHANARAMAHFFSLLACDKVDGKARILSKATLSAATEECTRLGGQAYGLGFSLNAQGSNTVPGQPLGTFGHGGLGGHISFGDPAAKMGFSYTMNLCVAGAEEVGGQRVLRQPGVRLKKVALQCMAEIEDLATLATWDAPSATL
jgi:CubicO group peptidase (beta-lactamase class C family)